eukprot:14007193-Heterocapsa_arctica.AAC.1
MRRRPEGSVALFSGSKYRGKVVARLETEKIGDAPCTRRGSRRRGRRVPGLAQVASPAADRLALRIT